MARQKPKLISTSGHLADSDGHLPYREPPPPPASDQPTALKPPLAKPFPRFPNRLCLFLLWMLILAAVDSEAKASEATGKNLETISLGPSSKEAVSAVRQLLRKPTRIILALRLNGTNLLDTLNLVAVLGASRDSRAAALLQPLILDSAREPVLRKQVIKALAKTSTGARMILESANDGDWPADLNLVAAMELADSRSSRIRQWAEAILPYPYGAQGEPILGWNRLAKFKPDPGNGWLVFQRPESGCLKCHQMNGQGRNVGPDLNEVGRRLDREGLLEAILAPSASVAFGYEACLIQLNSGEEFYGLIAHETPTALIGKDTIGRLITLAKTDIFENRTLKTSLMPSDLQITMTAQELVDLLAFLARPQQH